METSTAPLKGWGQGMTGSCAPTLMRAASSSDDLNKSKLNTSHSGSVSSAASSASSNKTDTTPVIRNSSGSSPNKSLLQESLLQDSLLHSDDNSVDDDSLYIDESLCLEDEPSSDNSRNMLGITPNKNGPSSYMSYRKGLHDNLNTSNDSNTNDNNNTPMTSFTIQNDKNDDPETSAISTPSTAPLDTTPTSHDEIERMLPTQEATPESRRPPASLFQANVSNITTTTALAQARTRNDKEDAESSRLAMDPHSAKQAQQQQQQDDKDDDDEDVYNDEYDGDGDDQTESVAVSAANGMVLSKGNNKEASDEDSIDSLGHKLRKFTRRIEKYKKFTQTPEEELMERGSVITFTDNSSRASSQQVSRSRLARFLDEQSGVAFVDPDNDTLGNGSYPLADAETMSRASFPLADAEGMSRSLIVSNTPEQEMMDQRRPSKVVIPISLMDSSSNFCLPVQLDVSTGGIYYGADPPRRPQPVRDPGCDAFSPLCFVPSFLRGGKRDPYDQHEYDFTDEEHGDSIKKQRNQRAERKARFRQLACILLSITLFCTIVLCFLGLTRGDSPINKSSDENETPQFGGTVRTFEPTQSPTPEPTASPATTAVENEPETTQTPAPTPAPSPTKHESWPTQTPDGPPTDGPTIAPSSTPSGSPITEPPTASPVVNPTSAPSTRPTSFSEENANYLTNLLQQANDASWDWTGQVQQEGSPQFMALQSLSSAENFDSFSDERLLQRYSIATLSLAMDGSRRHLAVADDDECTWDGVTCDAANSHITHLDWSDQFLHGELPHEIGLLAHVEEIRFGGNSISGGLPKTIGKLTKLKVLDFHGNFLTDELPAEIASCENLEELDLSGNEFVMELPASVGALQKLKYLRMDDNYFHGNIPDSFYDLKSLMVLSMEQNRLTGSIASSVSRLENLVILRLESNRLTELHADIGKLKKLQELDLRGNRFDHDLPGSIADLTKAIYIRLGGNLFRGALPNFGPANSLLQHLDLSVNELGGKIPESLSQCTKLRTLLLHTNKLTGGVPEKLKGLTRLREFRIEHNLLTEDVSEKVCEGLVNIVDFSSDCAAGMNCACCSICCDGDQCAPNTNNQGVR